MGSQVFFSLLDFIWRFSLGYHSGHSSGWLVGSFAPSFLIFFFFLIKIVFIFMCRGIYLRVCLCTTYVEFLQRPEEGLGYPGIGVTDKCLDTMWVLDIETGPLEEQPTYTFNH